ncbi:MAG: DUF2062 domain-containing protein [Bacteroidales bacterium]|nr:DUF2062 domain-containing protein [Bacteroidales bacterium]
MTFREWCKDVWDKSVESFRGGDTNFKLATSLGYGVMWGIIPLWGYQTVITLGTSHLLRLNKIVAFVGSLISLPPFVPFIVFGCYWTGCKVMGHQLLFSLGSISLKDLGSSMVEYLVGSCIVAVLAGLAVMLLTWGILALFRRASDNDLYL